MPLGPAAVTERYPMLAYLGLGANLGEPVRQVRWALELLAAAEEVEILKVSGFYRNPPLGPPDQPWYINAAAKIRTRLAPEDLLRLLKAVEADLGRVPGERWGPRLIDLDLLLYDGEVVDRGDLILPHPEMHRRAFVLVPLVEIAPEAWHPRLERTAAELLAALPPAAADGLQCLAEIEDNL